MDLADQLKRRISQLNKSKLVTVYPIKVHNDGHGSYLCAVTREDKSFISQIFVNPPAAKSINNGKNNRNLDKHLRL